MISRHRDQIHAVAKKYDVSPETIASIIYQEKYNGYTLTWLKDLLPDVNARSLRWPIPKDWTIRRGFKDWDLGSIGLAEMQIRTAAHLLGKNLSDPKQADEVVAALRDDNRSIDLIGRYVAENQRLIGRKLTPLEAGMGHNAGIVGLKSYVRGKTGLGKASTRIQGHEQEIRQALQGNYPEYTVPRIY